LAKTTFKRGEAKNMMPKRKSVIQQVIVLLTILAMLCSWPAVSGGLTGSAEKLIDERLQMESLFKTAESTPPTLTASKPNSSKIDMFSSASVWSPKEADPAWLQAWQECNDIDCVLEYMKKSGASEESMQFTKKIGEEVFGVLGYLDNFEEKGRVDLGSVFLPTRANTNGALVFLNGSPSLVSSEQRGLEQLKISGDSNYSMLKKQYPQLQIWGNGAGFVSEQADINGGQRFIFDYALVNYCHACYVGWQAQVAFDFSKDGTFRGTKFLKLVQDKNFAGSPIPDTTDEQLTQFASDIAFAIVQKSLAKGVTTVSAAVLTEAVVGISKQFPAPLMKRFLLNPEGAIGLTARIVNERASMEILSKVDPLGFALGVFSEALVKYLRESWQETDTPKLELYVFMIRESTVAYGALRGGTKGAVAAQAMVTGKTLFEVYDSAKGLYKDKVALREAEKMTLVGNRFLELRAEFLAESDPKVQCGKLAEIATFLAGEGTTVLIKDGTDLKLQIDKYVSALAQRSNITCDIEKLINTPKATETSPLTSCGSTLKERRALQAVELIKAALEGGESFDKVCRLHDVCYGDCITDRAECDNELLKNAYDACESAQNKESCYGFAHIFFTAVRAEGRTPFEKARAKCLFAPNYSDTHPLDDTTIKRMIISQLKDYIPIDLIGNFMSGTNGVVEEIEILEKSYEKEQLNAIGKAFLGEPKNYWGVVVRVKGHGQVGFNSMIAGMMSGDPDSKRSFNSKTKYRFYDAGGGSWSLVSPEEPRP
jgi:hypothetical protein